MPIPSADVGAIYAKDSKLRQEDVEALRDWTNKQPHLPDISEFQAILFLQSCYYSNELAKTTIDNFFTVRTICSDLFGNKSPSNPAVQSALQSVILTLLPNKTANNYTVLLGKLINCNPEMFNFGNCIRYFDMVEMLHLQENGPQDGLVIVFDMQGMVFGHLTRIGLLTMKKLFYYLQEAMPIRLKGMHFINVVPFVDKLLAMMKPFMKKELIEMLCVHANSIDTLYEFVPKECLPAEYGGGCESIKILHEKIKQKINDNPEFFQYDEALTVDETKRPGKPKNAGDFFGVEGTFKKLEVD